MRFANPVEYLTNPAGAPAAPVLSLRAKVRRSENIIKGYEATVRIVARPRPKFLALDPGVVAERENLDQKSVLADMRAELTLRDFLLDPRGDLYCTNSYYDQFFDFEIDDSQAIWEYDGGEVAVLGTAYDRQLEEP
jgi:hypothetical protein